MRKSFSVFVVIAVFFRAGFGAASRDANLRNTMLAARNNQTEISRATTTAQRTAAPAAASRGAKTSAQARGNSGRANTAAANSSTVVQSRAAAAKSVQSQGRKPVITKAGAVRSRSAIIASPATRKTALSARSAAASRPASRGRAAATDAVAAPADTTAAAVSSSRAGAAYEQCKEAYFTCMDQFCAVKNENYRRCSCSDKVYDLDSQQKVLESAAEKINDFNTGLDAVGLGAAQAEAMRKASEGELAMEADKSASSRLLSAIMNTISGSGETKVGGGTLEQLNSVSFENAGALFGNESTGQQIAAYNGQTLYSAVYGQCRNVVRETCADEALQRAVTAYIMAIENDCSTISTMLESNKKKMSAAVQESNAMLSLARAEDRDRHNSADAAECLNAVEAAVKDDQVCGENYKKCLDNGEFIDKDTGKPFAGVADFYRLAELLTFDAGAGSIADQKLTTISANKSFVNNFVSRNKKFAEPLLDKCVEISDQVWRDYLDKAMLEIYYAQKAKVDEIKRGCFDFVSACYVDGKKMVTDFMKDIVDSSGTALLPETISLTSELCDDYVQSCNKMFDEDLVSEYIEEIDTKDIMTTCRNVAKQCFDSYGGTGYNNFYNPASGLFRPGTALDWFTLYGNNREIISPCAKRLNEIEECRQNIAEIFGGMDKISGPVADDCYEYGIHKAKAPEDMDPNSCSLLNSYITAGNTRASGVATEVYNNIIGSLQTNCRIYEANFVEKRYMDTPSYCLARSQNSKYNDPWRGDVDVAAACQGKTPCDAVFWNSKSIYMTLADDYCFTKEEKDTEGKMISREPWTENLCPINNYTNIVDTNSWGICSCWDNGGRRVKLGSQTCQVYIPFVGDWTAVVNGQNQVCPYDKVNERSVDLCRSSGNRNACNKQ